MPSTTQEKILAYAEASEVFCRLRTEGKTLVQCHGTFDLVHPGHLIHFEEAKALGDILVVTLTGEQFVNKGPGRPYFNDALRAKSLASLHMVDYVVVIPFSAAVEAIECVKPDVYCKGKEYEDTRNDVTGNIHDDLSTVEKYGGSMAYVGSVVFSSTKLLNRGFDTHSEEVKAFCKAFGERFDSGWLRDEIDRWSDLKVLVVGDAIFDKYTTVNVQGLTSKNRIISGRYVADDVQAGGALAVYRHVRAFTNNVKILSLVGDDPVTDLMLGETVDPEHDWLIRDPRFTTIIKQRFVEPASERKEISKLFSINYIDDEAPVKEIQHELENRLKAVLSDFDLVLVMDFGHGMMQSTVREIVQDEAPFLFVNCQTNSYNRGYNIINQQYTKMNAFSLDLPELELAISQKTPDPQLSLQELKVSFNSDYAFLTRGPSSTLGLYNGKMSALCPALESDVVDTIGAGDAFCSVAAFACARGLPVDVATFLGQLAGAQAVKYAGNTQSIRKDKLLKAISALTSY
ncbi:MAG: PfkB family carbohydrate kinase [Opitutales bacterium]